MNKVRIGDRLIGEGEPCYIIAEAGVNHNGDISLAKKLIEEAAAAGADAVKFQTFIAEKVVTDSAPKVAYQKEATGDGESLLQMIKKLELSGRDFEELAEHARAKGVTFLSTPFDEESVDLLERLDVPVFKIASGEITNLPFLRHIAAKGRPVILSTGMSRLDEIGPAIETMRGEGLRDIILLHCVSCYPASIEDSNLRAIETLRQAFGLPVGFSDHSLGVTIPVAAAALGACVIEKHFTLDTQMPGPDHKASLAPRALKEMVAAIRTTEEALGDGIKQPKPAEEEVRRASRRSIVAAVDIPAGNLITEDMLAFKRPGTGIEPGKLDSVVGKKARAAIAAGELISPDNVAL